MRAELRKDPVPVESHGAVREEQLLADLRGAEPAGCNQRDLPLALGEAVTAVLLLATIGLRRQVPA